MIGPRFEKTTNHVEASKERLSSRTVVLLVADSIMKQVIFSLLGGNLMQELPLDGFAG
jgi:hypothetical protein